MKSNINIVILGALIASVSAMASDDFVTGSCVQELGKNSTDISSLKKSKVIDSDFKINPLGTHPIENRFTRVIPYATDVTKYRKHQVSILKNDSESVDGIDEEIPFAFKDIGGRMNIALRYGGRNEVGGPKITVDVVGLRNGMNQDNERVYKFINGKAHVEVKLDIEFNYNDYSYKGFLGIPGYFNDEIEKDGVEIHKVKLVTKCDFTLNENIITEDREDKKMKRKGKMPRVEEEEEKYENPEAEDFGTIYVNKSKVIQD